MDFINSNAFVAGLGIIGTLFGVVFGAWLNPKMLEWKEKAKIKKFIKECNDIEKFVIFSAYKMTFLPIDILPSQMILDLHKKLSREYTDNLNDFVLFLRQLDIIIHRLKEERKIFARYECNKNKQYESDGYSISLYSDMSSFIADNPNIKNQLMQETKKLVKNKLYPFYQHIFKKAIYAEIDNITLIKCILFMSNIGVFYLYNKDVDYLDFSNPQSYLNFPKGEMHPEFESN